MAHEHSIYDTDPHFMIDDITRAITTQSNKLKLMQLDHNSERFTFEIPRYIDGHDMSLCNKIDIHYNNIDAQTKEQSKDVYPVDDMQLSPDDENVVILSWLISRNATKFAGTLNFLICFSCIAEDATIEYAWHTDIYAGITVSNGIHNTEVVAEQYSDVLEAWKNEIEAAIVTDAHIVEVVENYLAENPIEVEDEIFLVEYGVTKFADIKSAYDSGKFVYCVNGQYIAPLVRVVGNYFYFATMQGSAHYFYQVNRTNKWETSESGIPTKTSQLTNDSGFITNENGETYRVNDILGSHRSYDSIVSAVTSNKLVYYVHDGAIYILDSYTHETDGTGFNYNCVAKFTTLGDNHTQKVLTLEYGGGGSMTPTVSVSTQELATKEEMDSVAATISDLIAISQGQEKKLIEINRRLYNIYFTTLTFSDFGISDQTITGGQTENTVIAKSNATVEANGLHRMSFVGYVTFPTTYESLVNKIQFGNLVYITPSAETTLLCGNPNTGGQYKVTIDNGTVMVGQEIKLQVDFEVIGSDYQVVVKVNNAELANFTIAGAATTFTYKSLVLQAGSGLQALVVKSC